MYDIIKEATDKAIVAGFKLGFWIGCAAGVFLALLVQLAFKAYA